MPSLAMTIASDSAALPVEPPAILDIEASGFGRASYPIEIGYVLPDGRTFCTLIRPAAHWTHWDPAAEKVHHVSRDSAVQHGREVALVARHLNDELHGRTLYCDGWAHDFPWLATLYEEAGIVPSFKLDHLRTLLTEREAAHWNIVKQQVRT